MISVHDAACIRRFEDTACTYYYFPNSERAQRETLTPRAEGHACGFCIRRVPAASHSSVAHRGLCISILSAEAVDEFHLRGIVNVFDSVVLPAPHVIGI